MRLLTLAATLGAIGCADLKAIVSLQRGLAREFEASAISVNLNNRVHLTVVFSGVPAGTSEAVYARRVAEYVRDHYPQYERLQTIRIGFGGVDAADAPFRFSPSELGPPRPEKEHFPVKVAER